MELLKKTLFIIIPISTLLLAVAYGLEVIFNKNITYLGMTLPNGQYYSNIYDFKSYLENLKPDNLIQPFINLGNSFNIIINPVKEIINIYEDGYQYGDFAYTIINIGITLINTLIFIIDICLSFIQCGITLFTKILSLIGININADLEILNVIRYLTNFKLIPGINPF